MDKNAIDDHVSDVMNRCVDTPEDSIDGRIVDITAGIDVTANGFEIEIVGWSLDEESWSIAHLKIEGCLDSCFTWEALRLVLEGVLETENSGIQVDAACIDSGGHNTQKVYEFAAANTGRHLGIIWAVKGAATHSPVDSPIWPIRRNENSHVVRPVIVGTGVAKDVIRARLFLEKPGPGFMHFPINRDVNYFAQLVSERPVTKIANGQKFRVWELPPGRASEALDCRVYAYAALLGLRQARSTISSTS